MSKMKDMAMAIEELRSAAVAISKVTHQEIHQEQRWTQEKLKLSIIHAALADLSREGQNPQICDTEPLRNSREMGGV